jgi:hypothetical protein
MKKTLIFAFAALSVLANAQSFSESFDTGPTGFIGGGTITFGNGAGTAMAFSSGSWFAFNASAPQGSTGWFNNNSVFAPHSGAGQLNANFNNTTGTNTINNLMMSPVRTFNNGDTISFWTRTFSPATFPDRMRLLLSTNGASTAVGDFSTVLLDINSGLTTTGYPTVYTQFSATLTGLGGPTSGRFALNYFVPGGGPSGANSDFIGIDDVQYTAVPEPGSMIALGLGAAALVARRRRSKKA